MKMTERSAKWMETVLANCESNTGRDLAEWVARARKARVKNADVARAWAKDQGLSIVYQTAVARRLFPAEDGDDELVLAQYSGAKASLRPIYDAVVKAARAFGADVEVMPRKSQVTLSRATSFAIVRASTKESRRHRSEAARREAHESPRPRRQGHEERPVSRRRRQGAERGRQGADRVAAEGVRPGRAGEAEIAPKLTPSPPGGSSHGAGQT